MLCILKSSRFAHPPPHTALRDTVTADDRASRSAKKTGVGTDMRKTSCRKKKRKWSISSVFLPPPSNAESRSFGYYWRCGKTKEVIHDKEPRYEETALVSVTGMGVGWGESQVLRLSCCSKSHIYHTATSLARKEADRAAEEGRMICSSGLMTLNTREWQVYGMKGDLVPASATLSAVPR